MEQDTPFLELGRLTDRIGGSKTGIGLVRGNKLTGKLPVQCDYCERPDVVVGSRRKAYYLTSIHEHLLLQARKPNQ
jgi:hypothetical protein